MIISSKDYKIQFFEEPEYVTKQSEKIENVINKFLAFFSVSKLEVDISFCTENEITKLNKLKITGYFLDYSKLVMESLGIKPVEKM